MNSGTIILKQGAALPAAAVFDATVTTDAGGAITSMNTPVSFAVNNEADGTGFVLRLHEETDGQGNNAVMATQVSETTDAAVIPFTSDLFSKYVIVSVPTYQLEAPVIQIEPVVSNTEELEIKIPLVENGQHYALEIQPVHTDEAVYQEEKEDEEVSEEGVLIFTVPAGLLTDCRA